MSGGILTLNTGETLKIMFTGMDLDRIIVKMAEKIDHDYCSRPGFVLCGILSGAYMFHARLSAAISTPHIVDFVRTSSYVGMNSSGNVQIGETHTILDDKDVIFVEDIVDTGLSMTKLIEKIQQVADPKSIEICTLLDKPAGRTHPITPKYVGHELVGEPFVIGFGMDYDQKFRHLPYVAELLK